MADHPVQAPTRLPKLALVGPIVAFLLALGNLVSAIFIYDSEIPDSGINKSVAMTSRKRWNRIFKLL